MPGADHPLTERFVRCVGRPAKEYVPDMNQHATQLFEVLALRA